MVRLFRGWVLGVLSVALGVCFPAGSAWGKFVVVALPDTQNYSANKAYPDYPDGAAEIYGAQTAWIVANREARNIQFVCHLGDLVDNGPDPNQWGVAHAAMRVLDDADVPYGTCLGNHDNHYGYGVSPDWDPNAPEYVAHFGPARFAGKSWYKGHSPSKRSNYQVIEVEGRGLLFLNLSIDTPTGELAWAQEVLEFNRDKLVVLSTHRHLYDFRAVQGRYGDGEFGTDTFEETALADERYDPEGIWPVQLFDEFVRINRNIFLVLCGHCHGQYYQVSENVWGLPVVEVLTDFQDGYNGGDGWLRLIEFDLEQGTLGFSSYSPTLDRDRTIVDEFMDTLEILTAKQDELAEALGLSALEKWLIMRQLRSDIGGYSKAPELEAYMHEPAVRAYLASKDMDYAWDGLWQEAYEDGHRDASFSVSVDFETYVEAGWLQLAEDLRRAQLGDLNLDGRVDLRDLSIFSENYLVEFEP